MKSYKKISNVRWFASNNTSIRYNTLNKVYDENDSELFESNINLLEIIFEEPYFFINDFEGNSYLIDSEYQYYESIFIKKILDGKKLLVSVDDQTKIFDIEKKNIQ